MREHDHRHRMVPPWPVPALVVIQAEFFFELAITWYGERLVCCSTGRVESIRPLQGGALEGMPSMTIGTGWCRLGQLRPWW